MTGSTKRPSSQWAAQFASVALTLGIFAIDLETPLGYAEWALYLLPIGLTLFQRRLWVPFAMTLAVTAFSAIGYLLSPVDSANHLAAVNRSMGVLACWVMAVVVWQGVRGRNDMGALLWLQQGASSIAQQLLGEQLPHEVAERATAAVCEALDAQTAVIYRREGQLLLREGGYALDLESAPPRIAVSDGLLGQVAVDGRTLQVQPVPEGHLPMVSALGRSSPRHLLVAPLTANGITMGVLELGFARPLAHLGHELSLLEKIAEPVGVALRSAVYRQRLEALLEETRRQSESLQAQQEELRVSNEELEAQSRSLQASQAHLEVQQVELEQTNVQLEEQAQVLERQKLDLLATQQELQANAERLETASRYKSEFLANMSHELRTPLNSSLILSKLLAGNKPGNLTKEQVKYAQAINDSNNDLLLLINDILDLSKIEAGHVDITVEPTPLAGVLDRLRAIFEPLAQQKGLSFRIDKTPGLPTDMVTDSQRLQQVMKNLLANAIKFTSRGEVALLLSGLPDDRLQFEVRDSGVGIPKHQHDIIFEAFRQADGSTSRRFGGTGLGLSISRELAHRLGGHITVDSEPGRGSRFLVDLPRVLDPATTVAPVPAPAPVAVAAAPSLSEAIAPPAAVIATASAPASPGATTDDRQQLSHPGRLILAVEDDKRFARVLYELAHELGFDCVIASTGLEALDLARQLKPSGILLDVGLPDQSGLTVLERLKRDAATRHLPVHMISAHERAQTAMELGAIGYVRKPADRDQLASAIQGLQARLQRKVRRVLIVEDDDTLRHNLVLLLSAERVEIKAVGSVAGALDELASSTFDCMVMDLQLADGSGYELLEKMSIGEQYGFPPVIVYTGRALSRDEEQRLRRYSRSIIVKGARSPERLLDEVTLFLHSVESSLPPEQQRLLSQARQRDSVLDGRRILLAEDDARNIFALSSIFEPLGAHLEIARNGREAIERLEQTTAPIDLVLMDIMMPEMDGIAAMKLIRARPDWANLPVIALTAKAMPEDRDRCLEAGANDYVSKPIDVDKLVSLCRVWCPK